MDSLTVTMTAAIAGRAKGVTGNSQLTTPLVKAFNVSLSSTLTGASQANSVFGPTTRTLASSANEELNLFSFTSSLNESGATLTECRLFYVKHADASAASSITVGNATADKFLPFSIPTATTLTLKPGEGFIFFAPTTTAMTVSNTAKFWKVLNNDGSNSASYEIFWTGSIA